MICTKCGKEVNGDYEFCMNCGTKVDKEATQKAATTKKKKIIIISIVSAIILIATIIMSFVINYNQERNGLYKNIAWGTSKGEVKKILEKESDIGEIIDESDYYICYELYEHCVSDILYGEVTFHFDRRSLCNIDIEYFSNEERWDKDVEMVVEKLSKLYGGTSSEILEDKASFSGHWKRKKGSVEVFGFKELEYIIVHYDVEK